MSEGREQLPDEPLSAKLRRDGRRHIHERDAWRQIVEGERVAADAEAAKKVVEDVLSRSPLHSWFPGTSWIPIAVVTHTLVGDPPSFPEWSPSIDTLRLVGPQSAKPAVGVVVQPADDPEPFSLLLVGRALNPERTIDLQVVLCERHGGAPQYGMPATWAPLVNITGPDRLARVLAAPDRWPDAALRPPTYGWEIDF